VENINKLDATTISSTTPIVETIISPEDYILKLGNLNFKFIQQLSVFGIINDPDLAIIL